MNSLLAVIFFVIAALPVALLFSRSVLALLWSFLTSAILAMLASLFHLAFGLGVVTGWLLLVAISWAAVLVPQKLRQRVFANAKTLPKRADYLTAFIWLVTVSVYCLRLPAAIGWDGRSIWFLHAKLLGLPGQQTIESLTNPAFAFSHPNYPYLGSGAVATVWQLTGEQNLVIANLLIALLSISLFVLVARKLVEVCGRDFNFFWAGVASIFVISETQLAQSSFVRGYQDSIQAGSLALLALLLLAILKQGLPFESGMSAALAATIAIHTKQEGLAFLAILILSFVVLNLKKLEIKFLWMLAPAVVTYAFFKFTLDVLVKVDETSDASGISGRLVELVDPGSTFYNVLSGSLGDYLISGLGKTVLLALVIWLITAGFYRKTKLNSAGFLALAIIGITVTMVLTYGLGNTRTGIDWWLESSFERISATAELLCLVLLFFALAKTRTATDLANKK